MTEREQDEIDYDDLYGEDEQPIAAKPTSRRDEAEEQQEAAEEEATKVNEVAAPLGEVDVDMTVDPREENALDDAVGMATDSIDSNATTALQVDNMEWFVSDADIIAWAASAVGANTGAPSAKLVKEISFNEHKINGKSKGNAFVEFYDLSTADATKKYIQGLGPVAGKRIQVNFAPPLPNPYKTLPKDPPSRTGRGASNGYSDRGSYTSSRGGGSGGGYSGSRGGYNAQRGGYGGSNQRGGMANAMMSGMPMMNPQAMMASMQSMMGRGMNNYRGGMMNARGGFNPQMMGFNPAQNYSPYGGQGNAHGNGNCNGTGQGSGTSEDNPHGQKRARQ